MTNATLTEACMGMEDVEAAVKSMSRDDLERMAGNAIALARLTSRRDFGVYARRVMENAVQRLISTCKPLDDHMIKLVQGAL